MRVPLSWLRDYVDFDLPPERLAERLTTLGMEVQSIDRIGAGWNSVVVGELLEVVPHPGADRLSLTRVRVSASDAPLSIVCGATNIVVGQRVPVALPGAVLPGGRQIGISTIQGTESQGMLCSGAELGLTTDSDGILILSAGADDSDGLKTALGTPLEDVVGDVILDIDVKPNRGDALSLIGLAREVAALTGSKLRWPLIEVPESGDSTDDHVFVEIGDKSLCPRFVARYVDGLKIGPSPIGVQLRLASAGMRPISNAVDASNYVMIEMGKPIHVFDAGAVSGGGIIVRSAHAGERLETLDHVVRELTPDTLVIADAGGAIGIAGVMGGATSEVGSSTTAVIVESAIFNPVSIRRTAHRYALRSEASLRFEKGQESRLARLGADRTAQLLAQWAGGRPAVGAVDTNPVDEPPRRVVYRPKRVSRLLGQQIEASQMTEALARIGIETGAPTPQDRLRIVDTEELPLEGDIEAAVAIVPSHRRDIAIEADVAEEIQRLRGFESLPPRLPDTGMPRYRPDPRRFEDTLRELVSGRGLSEVVTNGLIAPDEHLRLGFAVDDPATIRVANPVTIDHSELRRSLIPGLVGVLARNERQRRDEVQIFEVGAVHAWVDEGPWEADHLGLLLAGDWRVKSWSEQARPVSVEDAKGLIEWICNRFGVGAVAYRPGEALQKVEHPGRLAEVMVERGGEAIVIGRVGELDPRYLAASEVRAERVVFAVVELAVVDRLVRAVPQAREVDRLPPVERDVAVIVSRDIPAARVAVVIRTAAGPTLTRLEMFDRYQGPPLEPSQVSLAYRLHFQPTDAQLTDTQLESIVETVGAALVREVDGRIRSGS